MYVQLSPRLEAMVKQKVAAGGYSDASEVVEEALRMMEEQELRARQFKDSVAEGFAQVERGEYVELTPEHMDRIFERALENSRRGKPIKDDVKP